MKKKLFAALCPSLFMLTPNELFADENSTTALTIYSSAQAGAISPETYRDGGNGQNVPGYALIRQERNVNLDKPRNVVRFTDVAALIDPTTVSFTSLTDPEGTRVIEQNYQFDLVSTDKVLHKYIDSEISVEQQRGDKTEVIDGVLTSTAGNLILRKDDGSIRIVNGYSGIKLPKLPGGLITKPTLVWDIATSKPGEHRTRVAYQTTGITWWADYNFTYSEGKDANACKLDASAWVSILNQSGGSYQDAKLKLIAGDVQRAQPAPSPRMLMKGRVAEMAMADAAPLSPRAALAAGAGAGAGVGVGVGVAAEPKK